MGQVVLSIKGTEESKSSYNNQTDYNPENTPTLGNRKGSVNTANNSGNSPKAPLHETHEISNPLSDRKRINKITKGRAGVYVWTNNINGKVYVGGSIKLITRISMYYIPSIVSSSTRLIDRAVLKYGLMNFSLTIHLLPEGVKDRETVLALEQHYVDTLNPAYNLLKIAGSSVGNLISEAAKAKLRSERGTRIYVYSADASILLYVFLSRTLIMKLLHIHRSTITKFLDTEELYLNEFLFRTTPLDAANNSDTMEEQQFIDLFCCLQKAAKSLRAVTRHPSSVSISATHISDPSFSFVAHPSDKWLFTSLSINLKLVSM